MIRQWFILLLLWCGLAQAQSHSPNMDALFGSTFADLNKQPQALAQWKGKPLIVNFWARWCGPCRTEIPELIKLQKRFKPRGLVVIGIGIEDQVDAVREFAKAYEMDYTVLLAKDKGLDLMQALGNPRMGLPFTVAIDRAGKVVISKMGVLKGDELVAAAEAALK